MTARGIRQQNAERRLRHSKWEKPGLLKRLLRRLGIIW